jgi:hypothetical protein
MRRAAQILDHPKVFDDPISLRIIGAESAAALRADPQHLERSPRRVTCGRLLSEGLRSVCARRLPQVENQAVGVTNITAWYGRVLLLDGATCKQKALLGRLDVRNKEVEDRPVRLTLFHVEANGSGLEANECFAFTGDRKAED